MHTPSSTSTVSVVQSNPQLDQPKCGLPTLPNDIIKEIFLFLKNSSVKSERRTWKGLFCLTSKNGQAVINSVSVNIHWSSENMKDRGWLLKYQLAALIKDIFFTKFPYKPDEFIKIGEKYAICNQLPWVKQEFRIPEKKIIDNEKKELASKALSLLSNLSKDLSMSSYRLSVEDGQQFENALQILFQSKEDLFQPAQTSTPTLAFIPERSGSGEKILQIFARALYRCDQEKQLPVEQLNITQTQEIQKIAKMNPAALPFMMKIILSFYYRTDIELENEITTLFTECIKLWNSNERIYLGTLLDYWITGYNKNTHNPKFNLLNKLCEDPANKADPMNLALVCKKIPFWEDNHVIQEIKSLLEEIKFPKDLREKLLSYFLDSIYNIDWLSNKNIPLPVDDFVFFLEKVNPQLPDIKLLRIIQNIKSQSHKDVDLKSDFIAYLQSKYKHDPLVLQKKIDEC